MGPCRYTVVAALLCGLLASGCAPPQGNVPTEQDSKALAKVIQDVLAVRQLLATHAPAKKKRDDTPLTQDQRDKLLSVWSPHIDHDLALASYQERFLSGWQRAGDVDDSTRALAAGVAALTTQLAANLDFLEIGLANEAAQVAMDEADSQRGLPTGQFYRILLQTAKPHTMLRLSLAVDALRKRLPGLRAQGRAKDTALVKASDQGLAFAEDVEKRYAGVAPKLMARAVGQVASSQFHAVSGALVTNIALWLGDTRLRKQGKSLISAEQLVWLTTQAQPGDVMVERRNWYLSNLGLPGFWPHAELYLGTPQDLAAAFDQDPSVQKSFGSSGLTGWLQVHAKDAWSQYAAAAQDGEPHRVIEAISEGVLFSSLTEAAKADYLGVVRPRLSVLDKARAIAKAFDQTGKPYDFDFDFMTVDLLVCSELVYQAYLPDKGLQKGLELPLTEVMGRLTLPPNDIVRVFDAQFGLPTQQFDFVAFLDGREETATAVLGSAQDLRASWRRPKWDISQL